MHDHDEHDRRQQDRRDEDSKGIAMKALWGLLFVLWTVLFAVFGWLATTTATKIESMQRDITASAQEIALTKLNYQNLQRQLDRIEGKVDSVVTNQQQQDRRR
jgi:peptidoglycan hydrolase CwlO-like protein